MSAKNPRKGRRKTVSGSEALPDSDAARPPTEEQNRLATTLLLAAEALTRLRHQSAPPVFAQPRRGARPPLLQDFGGLCRLIGRIQTEIAQEPDWQALLSSLYEAFGDGETLWTLFCNLFPDTQGLATSGTASRTPLTERERDILHVASEDCSYEEIASRLSISRRTVDTHFENIYRKLGVHRPMQAVARAVVLGELNLNRFQLIRHLGDTSFRDNSLVNTLMHRVDDLNQEPHTQDWKPVAVFGLLLLLSGSTAALESYAIAPPYQSQGLLHEIDAQGRILRVLEPEGLRGFCLLAIAPPHAARQGFTPGNLFVVQKTLSQQGLNDNEVLELTPTGQAVRSFCGAQDIRLRLTGLFCPVFHPDGRLLIPSGSMTDAVLAFSYNGATVERFVEGCFTQICIGPSGNLYGSYSSSLGCEVRVFSQRGKLLHTLGKTPSGVYYEGVAVDSREHLFVQRLQHGHRYLEEYNAHQELVQEPPIPSRLEKLWYLDAHDRLHIPCPYTQDIVVLSREGSEERTVNLRGKTLPFGMAMGANGAYWISGCKASLEL